MSTRTVTSLNKFVGAFLLSIIVREHKSIIIPDVSLGHR